MAILELRAPNPPLLRAAEPDTYLGCHRIFCVGRNYADHAVEMGHDPEAEPPFFFMKPASALVRTGTEIPYPPATEDLHHEAELAVLLGRGGADIPVASAEDHVWGYAAANDLTRRDLQAEAKDKRRPWDMSKGFDKSCIVGSVSPARDVDLTDARIRCEVDGEIRQDGSTAQMIWKVPEVIAYLSGLVTLEPGDLILTGTPAGVGPIARGQTCLVMIDGLDPASVTVT